ncbi:inositol monophosphatase family protein [Planctomycetaceae bacterium SH139]
MQLELDAMLPIARRAAANAGQVLMRYLAEGVEIRNKSATGEGTYDLVSDADVEAERTIEAVLRAEFPSHDLLGEEELRGSADAEHLWIIDPLDGTNNFAHGIPHFAVSIAYWHRGVAQLGVVHNPARDDWYVAVRGQGATHNDRPAQVSSATSLDQVLVGCGFYYDRGEMMRATLAAIEALFTEQIHGIRRFGTASLDLCLVGCGQFGGFFEYQLAPWDFAAGKLFVEEAGGQVTTTAGEQLPLAKTSLLASNRHLHPALQALTSRFQPA